MHSHVVEDSIRAQVQRFHSGVAVLAGGLRSLVEACASHYKALHKPFVLILDGLDHVWRINAVSKRLAKARRTTQASSRNSKSEAIKFRSRIFTPLLPLFNLPRETIVQPATRLSQETAMSRPIPMKRRLLALSS